MLVCVCLQLSRLWQSLGMQARSPLPCLPRPHHCILPAGERRRKSVRGCIVSSDLSVLNLVIVKKGEQDLPGLTDEEKPRMRGPKRASKIRKLFNLSKVGRLYTRAHTHTHTHTHTRWFLLVLGNHRPLHSRSAGLVSCCSPSPVGSPLTRPCKQETLCTCQ